MTLIKSISGIRGTIGGNAGENLTPVDIARFSSAYGMWVKKNSKAAMPHVVIGRDARPSGEMVRSIVSSSLNAIGIDVTDLGLSTTPTVEMAVVNLKADGGIIITASHNPKNWNALKLLNYQGEFISASDGADILQLAEREEFQFVEVDSLGRYCHDDSQIQKHIEQILALPLVKVDAIRRKNFKIVIDCVNSTGGISVPLLLKALGVNQVTELYCTPDGNFPHNPEPLPENLSALSSEVKKQNAHLGFSVDPDVDRLAIVCENGEMFGEEYTLVAVADYVLRSENGATVSNLSSTRALRDVTQTHKQKHFSSAVGEVNVVKMMKEKKAVIGGEGNGGIIYPKLHYGRDALAGIALFLSHLAHSGKSCSGLRRTYPDYFMSKKKIELSPNINADNILLRMKDRFSDYQLNTVDGIRIDFNNSKLETPNSELPSGWVHLRKSNTEPIIRIYTESTSQANADSLADMIIGEINNLI
jgi:phosphomannomutase